MNTATVTIDDIGYGGRGIARIAGKVVMVAGTLPGETVEVVIRRRRRHWDDADLQAVITPAAARRTPVCPLALTSAADGGPPIACPGCVYQHVDYPVEKQLKQRQLSDLLKRFAGLTATVDDGAAALTYPPLGYRNKMVWQAQRRHGALRLGYAAGHRERVLDVTTCPLANPALNALSQPWRQSREANGLRSGDRVTFRHTATDGAVAWINQAPDNAVWLRETTGIGQLAVPRNTFFQVHPRMSDCLNAWVRERIEEYRMPCVVDLYCGVGVFALTAAADGTTQVIGVDRDGPAIRAATYNAGHMGYANVHFIAQPVHNVLGEQAVLTPGNQSVVILDPPRAGLDTQTLASLQQWKPRHILMISCAPDTLCRDLKSLTATHYDLDQIAWFDMFPRTASFETAAWLTLESAS